MIDNKEKEFREEYIKLIDDITAKKSELSRVHREWYKELVEITKAPDFTDKEQEYLKALGDKYAKLIIAIENELDVLNDKEQKLLKK